LKTFETPYNPASLIEDVCCFAKMITGSKNICAMGVALSGIVNIEQNTVVESANFPLAKSGIAKILSGKLNIPVILGNRSRLAAEFEGIYGSAGGEDNYIYVSLGKSVGSAVCVNGALFNGTNGAAGEIRNFPCMCDGKMSTLENLLSENTLLKKNGCSSIEELAEKWNTGVPEALQEMNKLIDTLCRIFAFLCDFTDIPLLIPGGRFRRFGKTFHTHFQQRFNTLPDADNRSRRVVFPDSGEDAPLYGAAVSAIRHRFCNLKPNRKGLEK
jgi:glucokinase